MNERQFIFHSPAPEQTHMTNINTFGSIFCMVDDKFTRALDQAAAWGTSIIDFHQDLHPIQHDHFVQGPFISRGRLKRSVVCGQ